MLFFFFTYIIYIIIYNVSYTYKLRTVYPILKLCHPLKWTACFPLRKKKSNKKYVKAFRK